MVLEISSELLATLRGAAAASPDAEICGLLLGCDLRVEAAEACTNIAAAPARTFEIDPVALLAAHKRARAGGAKVIGHYHSHPSGLPEPSATDAASAMGDGAVWLILGRDYARAWRTMERGMFEPIPLARVRPGASPG